MTTTIVKDSIVGDAWIQQTMQNVPVQRIIDPKTNNFNGDILTGPVRLSFADMFHLPAQRPGQSSQPKFGATIMFPPNVDFSILYEEYYAECGRTFPEYYVNGQYHGLHSPFRDQAEKLKFSGYTPGCVFMTVSSKFKPSVVDARMNPVVDESKVYPGVWAICAINTYSFGKNPPQPKKGVNFGLQSVMIIGDDTNIGSGGPDVKSHYAGVSVNAPVVRPDVANHMPPAAAAAPAPAAGIPGYSVQGGAAPTPGVAPVPQQAWVAPAGYGAPAPAEEDDDPSMYM